MNQKRNEMSFKMKIAINIITKTYGRNPTIYNGLASFESYIWESNKLHKKDITKRNELKCSHQQSLQHELSWISTKLNPINKYLKKYNYFARGSIDLQGECLRPQAISEWALSLAHDNAVKGPTGGDLQKIWKNTQRVENTTTLYEEFICLY